MEDAFRCGAGHTPTRQHIHIHGDKKDQHQGIYKDEGERLGNLDYHVLLKTFGLPRYRDIHTWMRACSSGAHKEAFAYMAASKYRRSPHKNPLQAGICPGCALLDPLGRGPLYAVRHINPYQPKDPHGRP